MNTNDTRRRRRGACKAPQSGLLALSVGCALLFATSAVAGLKYPLKGAGVNAEAKAMATCLTKLSASDGAHKRFRLSASFTDDGHPAVVAGALYPGATIYGAFFSSAKAASVPTPAVNIPVPTGATGNFGGANANSRYFWSGTQNVNSINDFLLCLDRVAYE
jgi:hypothetical protein